MRMLKALYDEKPIAYPTHMDQGRGEKALDLRAPFWALWFSFRTYKSFAFY